MTTTARVHGKDLAALLLGAAALWLSHTARAEPGERVTVLVANQGFEDAAYAHAVVVLQRDGSDEVGVIINRPSDYALANVLDAPAAAKASDPLYSGGPFMSQQLMALIRDEKSPGEGSMQLARGLYLSIGAAVLERAVERSPGTARYYAGLVLWQPGELADELKRGLWLKLEVPLDTVFRRDATGLWDELLLAAQAVRT
jgi:putative transcriptional regulator